MRTVAWAMVGVAVMGCAAGKARADLDMGRPDGCVIVGWADWALTKPILKCPEPVQPRSAE